jgi:hypothetical protein
VLILQRVRGEVASVAEGSGSSKAKFKPVPPPEVEIKDDPLSASPTFLSDRPKSDVEPEASLLGGRLIVSGVIYWSRYMKGSIVAYILYVYC